MAYAEPTNLTSLDGLVTYVNDITNNQFALWIPISLFIMCTLFFIINNWRYNDAVVASAFISACVTGLLYLAGWTTSTILFWTIAVLFIFSAMALYTRNLDAN